MVMPTAAQEVRQLIRSERRGGVLLAVIDMPGRGMNVFSPALMDALEMLLDAVDRDGSVRAVVLSSGKPTFLAGADLEMVRGFTASGRTASRAELARTCGRLGRLFVRLEASRKPFVAAVNGLALGGGLELAMACHRRIVADDPRIQLGLPEIKLGLLPGAGGTQRLPRLVGAEKGLDLLLSGRSLRPDQALALGLADEIAPAATLVERAIEAAESLAHDGAFRRMPQRLDAKALDDLAADAVAPMASRFGYGADILADYPAYAAIIRCVLEGADLPLAAGTDNEMERFVDLMQDEVAGNMVSTLFLDRQRAEKHLTRGEAYRSARIAVAGSGEQARLLRKALADLKVELADPAAATQADIVVSDMHDSAAARADILLSDDGRAPADRTLLHVAASQHGLAAEIATGDDESASARKALALARRIRATPWLHEGSSSLLAALRVVAGDGRAEGLSRGAIMARQALAADRWLAGRQGGDKAMADVACVVGGVFPAFAGGPFAHLAARGIEALRNLSSLPPEK